VAVDRSTVDTLRAALTYHRERHTVLTGNIANLDTPGYRSSDLERRIAGSEASDAATSFEHGGALQGSDGNTISRERELSKIAPTTRATRPPSGCRAGSQCCVTPLGTAPDVDYGFCSPQWKCPCPDCLQGARGWT
jgi:hypothetical protein